MSAALTATKLPVVGIPVSQPSPRTQYIGLRCPKCGANLAGMTYHALGQPHEAIECSRCSFLLMQEKGIWLALTIERFRHFERFLREYEIVRRAEGRGSTDFQYYLALPHVQSADPNAWQWTIRARTYSHIERKILPEFDLNASQPLTIIDLGAGNGWLSHRLARLGHRPIAVDLQTNELDGLGAAIHYRHTLPMLFPRFQAELDRLPFADNQFDCAIFNASFHYSENYGRTLSEAIRCLRPGGTVVIADTPSYSREEAGERMIAERRKTFQKRFGFASDSMNSREYLTKETLLQQQTTHGLRWTTHEVWYGIRWACRPLWAKLKGRREPSRFRVYTAQVKTR